MISKKIGLLLMALALVAASCGDDANPTTEAPDTTVAGTEAPATTEAPTTTMDAMADWPESVVFGFIPSEQGEELVNDIQPFMDYLSEELGVDFEGVVTADYNGLVVAMGNGQADFGAFGPFGYVQAKDQFPDIEVLIQSIRFGSDLYHGQWFTNDPSICDSDPVPGALENVDGVPTLFDPTEVAALQVGWAFGDNGLEPEVLDDGTAVDPGLACTADLSAVAGKKVAFTSATSTSGGVFPQLQLLNLGLDIESDIEYEYVGSHDNAVAAVYAGDFDIGLSFDDARRNIRSDSPDVGSKVIVFNITDDIPNDVVANRGDLPEDFLDAVFDAIKSFLETEEGELIFDEIYGWTDIRRASESDFDVVREAASKLGVTND
ncbi:MAG: phosphate/phosphite/phosphonate ABC transporter substrate-binding protein [Acidimicrobiia bacterium]|nr:phosphate/phosphite/phosphonate ABC transporter substrate-binding protein [Acidimicrobiia bacterium]